MKFVRPERAREKRAREIKARKLDRLEKQIDQMIRSRFQSDPLALTEAQKAEFMRLVLEPSPFLESVRIVPM